MRDFHAESYVRVDGSRLVTAAGKVLELHGINIGGWLVTENWICGFTDTADDTGNQHGRSAMESLENRFGAIQAAELTAIWQGHWITTADLDHIHDAGFNLVRVPISYRTLQHADGSWIRDASGRIDFSRMDWIVREAAARHIFTIFDLHVWPEQRTDYEKIGRPAGQAIRTAMAEMWAVIAAHYRGNGAILAFEVINEFPGAWGVQKDLINAVRSGDANRVVVVEGFTYPEFRSLHEAGAFSNSIYSMHVYADDPVKTEDLRARLQSMINRSFPVYVGEFLAQDFASATQLMNSADIHWSSWTYKAVDKGEWALLNYFSTVRTDIQRDSFATIKTKWSIDLTSGRLPGATPNFYINEHRRYTASPPQRAAGASADQSL